jgi:hypothetical protein
MRRRTLLSAALTLFFAVAFSQITPTLHAQTQSQNPTAQQQPQQSKSEQFTGQILQLKNGQYALVTGKTPQGSYSGHYLDDQKDAKKFSGQKVTVTGTLDIATNTIHVTNIQAA